MSLDPRSSSIFTRGAVDLGALRDRAQAQQAQQAPSAAADSVSGSADSPGTPPADVIGGGAAGGVVFDATEASFPTAIMERSMPPPVLAPFTSARVPQAAAMQTSLEQLAAEGGGAWVLARVDVDTQPRLAQAFQVQGIPTVYAVIKGQPVDGFAGVLPDSQVRQFVDAVVRAAGGEPPPAPEDPRHQTAYDALEQGDFDAAEREYKAILASSPADAEAEAGLAQVDLFRRVSTVDPERAVADAAAKPDDVAAQLAAADVEVLSGDAAAAYGRLVDLVRRTAGDDREAAREHLVSLFRIAAPDDPAVAKARRALASALF